MIFDQATLQKLEQLALVAEQVRVGLMKGDRRSRKRGSSVEFADYRNYVRGDDLRRLDWNVYARLERPFIKLLEEEEDLAVHLLLDASASMDWPPGGQAPHEAHKLTFALRLAAAIGYMALAGGDRLSVSLLTARGDGLASWGPLRGAQNSLRLFQFLESARPGGATNLDVSLRAYALQGGRPGLLFLLSDMLSEGYRDGLSALLGRGYELALLHILSPDEQEPLLSGDLKLLDVESGAQTELSVDALALNEYAERLRGWQAQIAAFCSQRGAHYIPLDSSEAWERVVLQTFRRRGVAR